MESQPENFDSMFHSLAVTEAILQDAKATIEELRNQVIPMRTLLKIISDKYWIEIDDAYCPYCNKWYGDLPEDMMNEDSDYNVHTDDCVISAARNFIKTVPEIK